MRRSLLAVILFFLISANVFSQQNTPTSIESEKTSGFACLKQFIGSWSVVSKTPEGQTAGEVVMTSRAVGQFWVVTEQRGEIGGTKFEAIQTLSYDEKSDAYFGTWVDSTSNRMWELKGVYNAKTKRLTLRSEGPDWNDPELLRNYRDVFEFKSNKEIHSFSQMQNDAGKWETFMSGTITRITEAKE